MILIKTTLWNSCMQNVVVKIIEYNNEKKKQYGGLNWACLFLQLIAMESEEESFILLFHRSEHRWHCSVCISPLISHLPLFLLFPIPFLKLNQYIVYEVADLSVSAIICSFFKLLIIVPISHTAIPTTTAFMSPSKSMLFTRCLSPAAKWWPWWTFGLSGWADKGLAWVGGTKWPMGGVPSYLNF